MPEITDQRFSKLEGKVNKIVEQLKDVNQNTLILNDSLGNFNKDFEDFRKKIEEVIKDSNNTKKTVTFLQAENMSLKKELSDLRSIIEEVHSRSKETEIDIVGIPSSAGEDCKKVVAEIASHLAVPIIANDIITAKRIISNKNKKFSIINVRFSRKNIRDDFLDKGKKSRLKANDIIPAEGATNVYFNECLSQFSRALLNATRQLKNSENYKFLWIKDGKIFLRKAEREAAIRISSHRDLEQLKTI